MFRIIYKKSEEVGGYFVRLPLMNQHIWVSSGYLVKVLETDLNVVLGCMDVEAAKLIELGFKMPLSLQREVS